MSGVQTFRGKHVFILSVALLVGLIGGTTLVSAETNPNQPRGLSAPTAYHLDDLDAVNLYAGNLTVSLPLAGPFPVSDQLSYRFTLHSNSNTWSFEQENVPENEEDPNGNEIQATIAEPDLEQSNAGLGWFLSFGRLVPPNTPVINDSADWLLIEGDGSRRVFKDHLFDSQAPETGVWYTRDGSYLRMKQVTRLDATVEWEIESPDGTTRVFSDGPFQNGGVIKEVTEIRDRFGSWIRLAHTLTGWTLTDSVGRTHRLHERQAAPGFGEIDRLEIAAFGGATAVYTFAYDDAVVPRHRKDSHPNNSLTVTVPLLTSITLPDGSRFAMETVRDNSFIYENPGMLKKLELPTGGWFEWDYFLYVFPLGSNNTSDPGQLEDIEAWSTGEGLSAKRAYDRDGTLLGTWTYSQGQRPDSKPPLPDGATDWELERRTWVTDPFGHQTVHYFTNWPAAFDHGLPYTTLLADTTASRFLSREVFDSTAMVANRLRSEYLRYGFLGSGSGGGPGWVTPRVESQRSVFHDDQDRFADVDHSDFDGYGHYRATSTGGNLPSGGNVRSTFTGFNPAVGTFAAPGFTPIASSAPWILNTFNEQSATEGGVTQRRQVCFDGATGAVIRERVLAGPSPGAADIVRDLSRNATGQVTVERFFGGDLQSVSTAGDLCSLSLPGTPGYAIHHTYQHAVRATTEQRDGARVLVKALDRSIDRNTGLVASSRDPAGVVTTFDYDTMGRIAEAVFQDEAATFTTITPETSTARAKIIVARQETAGSAALVQSEFELDGLGRVVKEKILRPDGGWSQRLVEYYATGQKKKVSEVQGNGTGGASLRWTQFLDLDPFGRIRQILSPDGHTVDLEYEGTRSVIRKVHGVATNLAGAEQTATTFEGYDRQGRLVSVTQAGAGPNGESVGAGYTYDVGGRLTQVTISAEGVSQQRSFTYDGRGFLLSEQHPEIDGAVLYSDYDAMGNAGRKRTGDLGGGVWLSDLSFTFDAAERLLRVTDGSGKVWKDFTYATANGTTAEGGTDYRAGKLVQARRHNWLPDGQGGEIDRVVTEQFVYGGPGGRVSEKRLRGQDAGGSGAVSFVQGFDYDLLGDLSSEIYPLCVSPRCERYGPPRVVDYQRSAGRLTAVPGWVNSITYNVNGWMDRVNFFNRNYQIQTQDANAMERPGRFQYDGGPLPLIDSGVFAYDGAGNITAIGSDRYAYDLVSRIKEANLGSVGASQSYTYDSFNNLTSITTTEASGTDVRTVGVDRTTNRLTGATYDAAGSVTSLLSITSLERDPFHKVAAMTGTGVNRQYLFTADDYRVAVVDELAGEETWSIRGLHDKVLRQYAKTEDGWIWDGDWIYRDGLLTASSRYAEMRFYLLDHLGSPRIVADPIGQLVTEYRSFPFGELASPLPENDPERNFRFTGHERDTHCTGCSLERQDDLDYMLARYYSPWMGRFLGVDPLLASGRTENPQSWNRYSYVLNRPVRLFDPTGEQPAVSQVQQPVPLSPKQALEALWRQLGKDNLTVDRNETAGLLRSTFEKITPAELSPDAARALSEILSGEDRPNVRNPGEYKNEEDGKSQRLPTVDENGDPIEYTEHTVNPRPPGEGLDSKRIVTGGGKIYYTDDHYRSFQEVELPDATPIEPE